MYIILTSHQENTVNVCVCVFSISCLSMENKCCAGAFRPRFVILDELAQYYGKLYHSGFLCSAASGADLFAAFGAFFQIRGLLGSERDSSHLQFFAMGKREGRRLPAPLLQTCALSFLDQRRATQL